MTIIHSKLYNVYCNYKSKSQLEFYGHNESLRCKNLRKLAHNFRSIQEISMSNRVTIHKLPNGAECRITILNIYETS